MTKLLLIMIIAFVTSAFLGVLLIPILHHLKFGQEIREEGPKWHQKKSGTPTMGGIIFIGGSMLAMLLGLPLLEGNKMQLFKELFVLMMTAFAFGAIGFLDDYIKVILKRNLGLRAGQKFSLQFAVAVLFSAWLVLGDFVKPEIAIPFTDFVIGANVFVYIAFIVLVMLAAVNSVNLTDGLDGLATCITLVVSVFYFISSYIAKNNAVTVFAVSLIGALLGFLIYNKFPAKVFMGDTGSLFLGGAVAVMSIYSGNPLLLLIVGAVYVIEALSVIIQVTYFKKTGKRIFKMSPIHHHFEMCGWSEVKIVAVFSLVTAALCALAFPA